MRIALCYWWQKLVHTFLATNTDINQDTHMHDHPFVLLPVISDKNKNDLKENADCIRCSSNTENRLCNQIK